MQPWKISVGLTAIIMAGALMLAGESFSWMRTLLLDRCHRSSGCLFRGTQVLAVAALMFAIYSGARLMGLADTGRKVDLMERSIRRGEGGQTELAEKLEQEERGEYPGA